MKKWLCMFYPVYPAERLEIHDLSILDYDDHLLKTQQDKLRIYLDMYNFAKERHRVDKSGIVMYNNSNWLIVEAESMFGVMNKFLEHFKKS